MSLYIWPKNCFGQSIIIIAAEITFDLTYFNILLWYSTHLLNILKNRFKEIMGNQRVLILLVTTLVILVIPVSLVTTNSIYGFAKNSKVRCYRKYHEYKV